MSPWIISSKICLWFKLAEQNNGLRNEKLKENMQHSANYIVWSRLQLLSSNLQKHSSIDNIAILNVKNIIFSVWNLVMLHSSYWNLNVKKLIYQYASYDFF